MNDQEIKKLADERFYGDEAQVRYLLDTNLLENLNAELGKKIVGEEGARKAILLASCFSFVRENGAADIPNLLINTASSGGKDYVVRNVLALFGSGSERVIRRTKITPELFTYWMRDESEKGGFTWEGRVLYLPDIEQKLLDSSTFKTMMSDGTEATVLIKQKPTTIKILGRPLFILTSAKAAPNDEMMNRFDLLHLNETQAQTRAIFQFIAKLAQGNLQRHEEYSGLAMGVFKALRQVNVVIPFADKLSEVFPCEDLRGRRSFRRMLAYICASAALHQFQRKIVEDGKIEADLQDYENARDALRFVKIAGNEAKLTRIQKRAWDMLANYANDRTLNGRAFSTRELSAACPSIGYEAWRRKLVKFAELGLVESELKEQENTRPVQVFKAIGSVAGYVLPPASELLGKGVSGTYGVKSGESGLSGFVSGNPPNPPNTPCFSQTKLPIPNNTEVATPKFSEKEDISTIAPGNRLLELARKGEAQHD